MRSEGMRLRQKFDHPASLRHIHLLSQIERNLAIHRVRCNQNFLLLAVLTAEHARPGFMKFYIVVWPLLDHITS
ncbi:hypothetical protein VFPPC_16574 [Pochonia chlamydosporia 170]|uniref:Uncharacterized protein n=1 Tax=Pochonia chlamydosporia 170 TaxID=1380566 RepID=A0A179F8X1_METCM|nr:hypothetical protein VFPPC_16574 [Pochonia chlamydosporia 170]OAQ61878.1 hypothetical protein VFPPC_16574 [Pochonia chlamydosporia 170]